MLPNFPPGVPEAWVAFKLSDLDLAIGLAVVERVIRAVEVRPVPEAPHGVRGVINVQGHVLPVFDLWRILGLTSRELRSTDFLVICHTSWRRVALLVDSVTGVISRRQAQITPAAEILPDMESVTGIMKVGTNLVLVHDLERLLSIKEHEARQLLLDL
jgi:purine-binding chemotaxis protein CheW